LIDKEKLTSPISTEKWGLLLQVVKEPDCLVAVRRS
jgi:hypothetical protein